MGVCNPELSFAHTYTVGLNSLLQQRPVIPAEML